MKKNNKAIIKNIVISLLIIIAYFPLLVLGNDVTLSPVGTISTVEDFLIGVRNFLWILVAPLSAIMIIWAGILFVTSQGDPQKVQKAKSLLTYIIIGIFVALLATGIVEIIKRL